MPHHNPERHWKGRSYKKGGTPISELKLQVILADLPQHPVDGDLIRFVDDWDKVCVDHGHTPSEVMNAIVERQNNPTPTLWTGDYKGAEVRVIKKPSSLGPVTVQERDPYGDWEDLDPIHVKTYAEVLSIAIASKV